MKFSRPSLVNLILLFSVAITTFTSSAPHPYHVSYTEVNYHSDQSRITVSMELFTDDLENAVKLSLKPTKFFLGADSLSTEAESYIQAYVKDRLTVMIDGVVLRDLQFLPSESNPDRTTIYFEFTEVAPFTSFTFYTEVLIELFDDQQNIVEFQSKDEKQKALLSKDKKSITWITSN